MPIPLETIARRLEANRPAEDALFGAAYAKLKGELANKGFAEGQSGFRSTDRNAVSTTAIPFVGERGVLTVTNVNTTRAIDKMVGRFVGANTQVFVEGDNQEDFYGRFK